MSVPHNAGTGAGWCRTWSAPHPLFHFLVCRVPVEFGKYLDCILMTAGNKSKQFISISSFAGQLDQDVHRITAATIGKRSQFIEITSLAGQLD